jgi:hypothetical protein
MRKRAWTIEMMILERAASQRTAKRIDRNRRVEQAGDEERAAKIAERVER